MPAEQQEILCDLLDGPAEGSDRNPDIHALLAPGYILSIHESDAGRGTHVLDLADGVRQVVQEYRDEQLDLLALRTVAQASKLQLATLALFRIPKDQELLDWPKPGTVELRQLYSVFIGLEEEGVLVSGDPERGLRRFSIRPELISPLEKRTGSTFGREWIEFRLDDIPPTRRQGPGDPSRSW
jgi:hypothetical protein